MIRIASFNVENLFQRSKALNGDTWDVGQPILAAYREVNELFAADPYTPATRDRIRDLLVALDIYYVNTHGAVRRRLTKDPKWAWLRKSRGDFDREPRDATESVEIVATGRGDWIGWVELAKQPVDELATRMTARVIREIGADVMGVIEAEDRPALTRFNRELLDGHFRHVMLVDGNDDRGIDVGIMTREGFRIGSIHSSVDALDAGGKPVFDRDCARYEVLTPGGAPVHVLLNHFKSQSGGGGGRRKLQAAEVRKIANALTAASLHVVVAGDLNEGPAAEDSFAENLQPLIEGDSPLVPCYALPGFNVGPRPGTFDACGIRNRLDYVLISRSLQPHFRSGGIFRKGLWGSRVTRPTAWDTYPEMTRASESASDHAAVFVDLDL
jgi:endonuclease/exonuclease/phosphatase family metal-dependent hydrolase